MFLNACHVNIGNLHKIGHLTCLDKIVHFFDIVCSFDLIRIFGCTRTGHFCIDRERSGSKGYESQIA